MATLTNSAVNTRKLLYLVPIAGLAAAILNAILFLIGSSTGAFSPDYINPNTGQPITVGPVIMASIVPALVAGILLALLNRFTKNPLKIFNIIALVVFVLMFATPLMLPNAPMGMVVILELMHVVVAGVVVWVFNKYAKN
ncbi:DUF6069 family protein [Spirosoma soli]|uniref:DUF6069 family protein n=1 Tax=Spirosoma soli TaxID=1770529 RepID=A0ABW5M0K6_9BACT